MPHYLPYGGGNRRAALGAEAAVDARDPQPELLSMAQVKTLVASLLFTAAAAVVLLLT